MALTKYTPSNNAQGQLLAGISAGAVTLILQSGQGGRFPSVYPYLLEVKQNDTVAPYAVLKREIVKVTNRVGDTFTIVRSSGTCLPDDSSNTPGTTAFSFSTGDTVTLTVTAETIKDIQDELVTKLAINGGTRTGLAINGLITTNGSGVEQVQTMTTDSSFISTDELIKRTAGGSIVRTPYSILANSLNGANSISMIAGESLALWDMVYGEEIFSNYLASKANQKAVLQKMGDVIGNTRISSRIIGNGTAFTTMKIDVYKTGAPADNIQVRIETDDGTGKPSGTAVTNGTSSIAGGTITATYVDTTFTFAGSITLTLGTVYHVVIQRSAGVDPTNYYNIMHLTKNVRAFTTNLYNGTVWGTAITTKSMYMVLTGVMQVLACKTSASFIEQTYFTGIINTATAIGVEALIQKIGVTRTLTGLTKNTFYHLSNTAGLVSSTPGTVIRMVWYSDNRTDALTVIPQEDNPSFSETNQVLYETIYTGASFMWKADFPTTLFITCTPSGGYVQLYKNATTIRELAGFGSAVTDTVTVLPGDIIYASATTSVVVQVLAKPQAFGRQFTA